jgi:hypothetical protein
VAEIAELASNGDTRLVVIFLSASPPETERLSSGISMAARGPWLWRVWSTFGVWRGHIFFGAVI